MTDPNASMETTASYAELASDLFTQWVNAVSLTNQRVFGYWRGLAQLAAKPYEDVNSFEDLINEQAARSNAAVKLTVREIEVFGAMMTLVAKNLATFAGKVQDQNVGAARGLYATGVSNLNFVRNSATRLERIAS